MSCKRAYMKKLPNPINPGDVYRKNERFESVWIVKDHLYLYGHPTLPQSISRDGKSRTDHLRVDRTILGRAD